MSSRILAMFDAVIIGFGSVIFMAFGVWLVGPQHRRRSDTRAGWGVIAIGLAQLFHAADSWAGSRQPLGHIPAACCLAFSIAGFILVVRAGDILRDGRGGRKRRKLPPLHP
ncbi:hypothetical protein AB0K74_47730 [Streptomyces sp. NPDC056159]|uniref:hypothetical protein n=1 Tax=Streptomyces sp. NPDC056159 TaxID=3155537 RepID=UPI0034174552